mmetsp:Transcript_6215/g.12634  ORF Transcript_6215/g.12634 Transcript_6215/m.12634 type:complete len:219 (+) Transcript_6215:919-1575(+)
MRVGLMRSWLHALPRAPAVIKTSEIISLPVIVNTAIVIIVIVAIRMVCLSIFHFGVGMPLLSPQVSIFLAAFLAAIKVWSCKLFVPAHTKVSIQALIPWLIKWPLATAQRDGNGTIMVSFKWRNDRLFFHSLPSSNKTAPTLDKRSVDSSCTAKLCFWRWGASFGRFRSLFTGIFALCTDLCCFNLRFANCPTPITIIHAVHIWKCSFWHLDEAWFAR